MAARRASSAVWTLAIPILIGVVAACHSASPIQPGPGGGGPTQEPGDSVRFESADLWNYPNRNFFRCVVLKSDSTPLLWEDGSPVAARGKYEVRTSATEYDPGAEKMSCEPGQIRLDAHEALKTARGVLQFHKGGQGYLDSRTPYGHIAAADIVDGDRIETQRPLETPTEWGAPSAISGGGWDTVHRNGRGCEPVEGMEYHVAIIPAGSPRSLPTDWQYKPNQTSSRYAKYADAGPEQGDGSAHYAYLVWSWMLRGDGGTTSGGGGMVRSIMRDGQTFYRCAVQPIDGIAWAPGSSQQIGRVTAVYGKTRASEDGPWVYGWAVFSHRHLLPGGGYGPEVFHMSK